jgi:hypothetical protein
MKKLFLAAIIIISCNTKKEVSYGVFSPSIDTLNPDGSINLYAFGAKLDCITDDLPAWNAAITYATSKTAKSRTIKVPFEKISRITGTIVVGGKFIDVQYMLNNIDDVTVAPSNITEYQRGVSTIHIKIIGETNSGIYADFNDTSKLQAAIYMGGMYGDKRSALSVEQYYLEISHLGIYAQGYFVNGKRFGTITTNADYSKNNVCAIASAFCYGLRLDNLTIFGFKESQIHNNSYNIDERDVITWYCKRAGYDIRCHRKNMYNVANFYCEKGAEVRSNKVLINGYYSLGSKTGLHIAGANNTIISAYLESAVTGEGQLVLGDSIANPTNNQLLNGIVFIDLTMSCPYKTGINLKDNVRKVSIIGGDCQSMNFVYTNPATRIQLDNVLGVFPAAITIKAAYIDNTGKVIY